MEHDRIAEKLKKIKALADRGVGGEKETAMRMYEELKARYEIKDEEIMLDTVSLHWLRYTEKVDCKRQTSSGKGINNGKHTESSNESHKQRYARIYPAQRHCISWGKDSSKEPVRQQISRKEETPYKINRDQQRKRESDHIRRGNRQSGN